MPVRAIYTRKSHFTSAGESIENQIQICTAYINGHFSEPGQILVYQDEGFSGKNTDRPEFQRMLNDMHSGKFDTLVCYRLDRISRSVSDFSATLEDLTAHNVTFISTSENFDTSTPIGRAMIYIASVFAELERETIAERVRDNKYQLYRTGRWQGGQPPVGFTAQKVFDLDSEGRKRSYFRLRVDESTAPHVKLLFDEMLRFGSLTGLEGYLLKKRVLSMQGKEYSASVLRQIVSNPIYAKNDQAMYDYLTKAGCDLANSREEYDGKHGLIGYGKTQTINKKKGVRARTQISKWIIAVAPHQGLVPGSQWVAIQNKIAANAQQYPRVGTGRYSLLSGMLRCGRCHAPMAVKNHATRADGTTGFTYKCSRKHRSSGELCNIANAAGPGLDSAVIALLRGLFLSGNELKAFLAALCHRSRSSSAKPEEEREIQALRAKISNNQERMGTLIRKLGDSGNRHIDQMIYEAIEGLREETAQLSARLAELQQTEHLRQTELYSLEDLQQEISDFCIALDKKQLEIQRQIVKNIVKQVVWYGEDFEAELLSEGYR